MDTNNLLKRPNITKKEIHNQNSRSHFKVRSMTQYSSMNQHQKKLSQDQLKKIAFKADNKKPSGFIIGTVNNSKRMVAQQPPIYQNFQMQKQMIQQRRQLENLRLQEDSQDTRLMKIQHKEKKVNEQYTREKLNMETELTKLVKAAQQHHDEQNKANEKLENQKKISIQINDDKIKTMRERKQRDQEKNMKLRQEIEEVRQKIQDQDNEMVNTINEINRTKKYEDFLIKVIPDFAEDDYTHDASTVIKIFNQLEKVQKDLTSDSGNIEADINNIKKQINDINRSTQQINLKGVSDMNDIKKDIEKLHADIKNITLQIQIIEKERLSIQIEQAQYLMAIKNIHNQYQYTKPKHDKQTLIQKSKIENITFLNKQKDENKNKISRQKDQDEDSTQDILKMVHWIGEKINHLQKVKKHFEKKIENNDKI